MSDKRKKILIIEDELHIAEGLRLNLEMQGYAIEVAPTGSIGVQLWKDWRPDLVVLDLMLPGIDGFSVLQNIRLEDEKLPVLILSAKADADDKVKGLAMGSDDYLAKPFNLEEFLLRVRRLLQRSRWGAAQDEDQTLKEFPDDMFAFGSNRIDFKTATAECRGEQVQLTEQEVRLLKIFIKNKGKPISRKRLLEIGWGYTGGMSTRTVDNFMVRLRKYFEDDPKNPRYFKSRRSVGYIFDPDGE